MNLSFIIYLNNEVLLFYYYSLNNFNILFNFSKNEVYHNLIKVMPYFFKSQFLIFKKIICKN